VNKNKNMKYSIKLEQIIDHEILGEVVINARYDSVGIKMLDLDIESLTDGDRNVLQPILALVNLSLAKNVNKQDIIEQLEFQAEMTKDSVQIVLAMVLEILESVPTAIINILPESLVDISPEFVREYMKANKLS
jgi:hypothetical protein